MADYLLKNTQNIIVGGIRRLSVKNHKNIQHLEHNPRFKLIDLDVTDHQNTNEVILRVVKNLVISIIHPKTKSTPLDQEAHMAPQKLLQDT